MKNLLNSIAAWMAAAAFAVIAGGLLIAAAIVGLGNVVGAGGSLAIVGGVIALIALTFALVARRSGRRAAPPTPEGRTGRLAGAFLAGLWEGLSKPHNRS